MNLFLGTASTILILFIFFFFPSPGLGQASLLSPCAYSLVHIDPPTFDAERNRYSTHVTINQSEKVNYLRVLLSDNDGVRIYSHDEPVRERRSIPLEFDSQGFEVGYEYQVTVTPVDYEGNVCQNPDNKLKGQVSFKYQTPIPSPIAVKVQSAYIDPVLWQLVFNFDVSKEEAVDDYRISLKSDNTTYLTNDQEPITRLQIMEYFIRKTIPENSPIRKLEQPIEYKLEFCTFGKVDQSVCSEEPFTFTYTPPLPLTTWRRISYQMSENSYLLAAIVAIISALIVWLAMKGNGSTPNMYGNSGFIQLIVLNIYS